MNLNKIFSSMFDEQSDSKKENAKLEKQKKLAWKWLIKDFKTLWMSDPDLSKSMNSNPDWKVDLSFNEDDVAAEISFTSQPDDIQSLFFIFTIKHISENNFSINTTRELNARTFDYTKFNKKLLLSCIEEFFKSFK